MAGLANIETIKENARALELFMHVSPEAASFLDCFTLERTTRNSQIALVFESAYLPNEPTIPAISSTPDHLAAYKKIKESIEANQQKAIVCEQHIQQLFPAKNLIRKNKKEEGLDMIGIFDLANPNLKDVILETAVRLINERLRNDPEYAFAQFTDASTKVRVEDLEKLLPQMSELPEVIDSREASIAPPRR